MVGSFPRHFNYLKNITVGFVDRSSRLSSRILVSFSVVSWLPLKYVIVAARILGEMPRLGITKSDSSRGAHEND